MHPPPSAPRLAAAWIRWLAPAPDRDHVLADLADEFAEQANLNPRNARRWYWQQVITSTGPLLRWRLRNALRAPHIISPPEGDGMWLRLVEDLRSTARISRRSPLTTATVIFTIILGVGATTAVFSIANAILLRPLPFAQSARVVELSGVLRDGTSFPQLAYPDIGDFRDQVRDFDVVSTYTTSSVTLQRGTAPRLINAVGVDEHYADVFALHSALGHLLNAADNAPNAPPVVVISHAFWLREFGGSPDALGKQLLLDNNSYQIVGVLAADAYTYPTDNADLLLPLGVQPGSPSTNRGRMWANAAARLAPGATFEHAERTLTTVASRLAVTYPDANTGISARITPLRDAVVGSVRSVVMLLSLTVGAVLLIACVNVANMLLARAESRSREFAVRSALGGTPSRLRRQVLTESLVLAIVGGLAGLALAPVLIRVLIAAYPDALPRGGEVKIDLRVLLVASGAVLLAGIASGLPTARRLLRLDLVRDLRDRSQRPGGRASRRLSSALIVVQVATSLALLVAAGLLLQTFRGLTHRRLGFDPAYTTTFRVYADPVRYPATHDIEQFYTSLVNGVSNIPGVRAVATSTRVPFGPGGSYDVWVQEELGDQGPGKNPSGAIAVVTPGFDKALGVRVLSGRSFTVADDSSAARAVMINDAAARKFYPGVDPVGKYVEWGYGAHWRIVGVLAATPLNTIWEAPIPLLYAPAAQQPKRARYLVIRGDAPPTSLLSQVRPALHAIDPTVAITDVQSMQERLDQSLGAQRFRATLVTGIGALALVLAVIGLYGVVAFSVSQRTRELGIRMALGETRGRVRGRVMLGALQLALTGAVLGIACSLIAGRWLATFLIDVSPHDARVLASATALLIAVVLLAADAPARRAARVDPLVALRE